MKPLRFKFTQSVLVQCNDWEGLVNHLVDTEWDKYFFKLDKEDIEGSSKDLAQDIGIQMIHEQDSYRAVQGEVTRFIEGFGMFYRVSEGRYDTYTCFVADKFWLVAYLEHDEDEVEDGRW